MKKRTIEVLALTFAIAILLLISSYNGYVAYEQHTAKSPSKTELDLNNVPTLLNITGDSMIPTFDSSSRVYGIKVNDPSELHIGDIITYTPKNGAIPITHRITIISTDTEGTYYTTKGDHNLLKDMEKIRYGNVLYKVKMVMY